MYTGDAAAVRDFGQDVAPNCCIGPATVVEDDHAAGRHVVNEVTNGARGRSSRAIENRERTASHAEGWIPGLDLRALTVQAQAIQCVAEGRRLQFRCARNVLVLLNIGHF